MSRPSVCMSTMKYVMPACLDASGSERARQMPKSAICASDVQTFWPLRTQPPSTRSARVLSAARSDPAPGSLKSWHQLSLPCRVGRTQRSCCSEVPWAMMVGRAQAPHRQVGPPQAGGRQLLVDDQLLQRRRTPAPRRRPVRHDQPRLGEGRPAARPARRLPPRATTARISARSDSASDGRSAARLRRAPAMARSATSCSRRRRRRPRRTAGSPWPASGRSARRAPR